MAELTPGNWDLIAGQVRFDPRMLGSQKVPFKVTNSDAFGTNAARVCVQCNALYPLERCDNCSGFGFLPGVGNGGVVGLFCEKCQHGFTQWNCEGCGTVNPIAKSLAIEKGCFVATAAFGGPFAPEVCELRALREDIVMRTQWGRDFVRRFNTHYYSFSPLIADAMHRDEEMRDVIGWSLVTPLLQHFRAILRRPQLSTDELENLPPKVREYLEFEISETALWLSRVPRVPDLADSSPADTIIEIMVRLRVLCMTTDERRGYLEELKLAGVVPVVIDAGGLNEVAEVLTALGVLRSDLEEVARLG